MYFLTVQEVEEFGRAMGYVGLGTALMASFKWITSVKTIFAYKVSLC